MSVKLTITIVHTISDEDSSVVADLTETHGPEEAVWEIIGACEMPRLTSAQLDWAELKMEDAT